MDANSCLNNLLHSSGHYTLTNNDSDLIKNVGIGEWIISKLFSKRYRKWRLDEECIKLVKEEVNDAVVQRRPIRIFFAQGAYKLWRVSSSPRANWAEFFNIAYLVSYLAPIVAAYEYGCELTYFFLTILPQTHNNLSIEDVDAYLESFRTLVNNFSNSIPSNLQLRIVTDLDLHSRGKYNHLLADAMLLAEERFYAWPQAKQADYIRRAWLNIKWDGVQDWTNLDDHEKARLVKKAVLYEYAATQDVLVEDKRGKGVILSTLPKEDSIGIGSTFTSVANHWVGEGVLEMDGGNYYPRILSPSQYDLARLTKHKVEKVNVFPGKEFQKIEVFPKHFDFTQK